MNWGILFAFGQALIMAHVTIALRGLAARLDAFLINALCGCMGLGVLIPLMLLTGAWGDYARLTWTHALFVLALSVSGVAGDVLYLTSLRTLGVSRAFPIANSYPLFTVLASALFLAERLRWTAMLGMLIVLLGTALTVGGIMLVL